MNKNCPKCKSSFECQADNIEQCQCSQIRLEDKTKSLLQATYTDCLCISCLQHIQEALNNPLPPVHK